MSRKPATGHQPPAWAQRFIEWYCRPQLAEDLMGDLHECFVRNVESMGPRRAKLIYIIDAFKFFRTYTVRKPTFVHFIIDWIMIGSYIKTSVRNVARNKLFSTINIAGLAISMSVGLLLIAFGHDMMSYDRFNVNGSRIYRITSQATSPQGHREKFASTSVRTGKLIREKVPGVEETVIMRTEFGGDAKVGDNVVPLTGVYAEPSMLRVFTLPMLKGDPATALNDPYSLVLTETSAKKLFGAGDALGKDIHLNDRDFKVTGILKDVPFFSHLQFESLVSFSTIETQMTDDPSFLKWGSVWHRNYVYVMLNGNARASGVQKQIDAICDDENKAQTEAKIHLALLPLYDIVTGEALDNSIGPVMPAIVLWIMAGLALVVILSACFNYTNLSMARAMRRFREIGLRKVIGAGRSQVRMQFFAEAVIVSLVALLLSFGIFLVLRPQFTGIAPELLKMVRLEVTTPMVLMFIAFSMGVGIVAGFLPAIFFAKVSAVHALKDASSVKVFRGLSFRRALVIVQYTLTLIFITGTFIGYVQYKDILAFDLGFNTKNILNISLQKNEPTVLIDKLKAMPEVAGVSQSRLLTSVGNAWGGYVKYREPGDSTLVLTNIIDEHYLPLHRYKLVAGQNFVTRPVTREATTEVIVNERTLRLLNIANNDPEKAIGEELLLDNRKLNITGVIRDFHYSKLDENIQPVVFTYLTPDAFLTSTKRDGLVNVLVDTSDPVATMAKIEAVWKSIDPVHPFQGAFYDDSIEDAYHELSAMIRVIGFLSFIAISIASLGLLGMVVFTTETRLKEISIRKTLGATSGSLVLLLSRGFIALLGVSALIAVPVTYLFFEFVVLVHFPFHEAIGIGELFGGLLAVLAIAFAMIGSQTLKAAYSNPAETLKCD